MRLAGKRIGLLTASASRLGGGVAEAVVRQATLIAAAGGEPVIVTLADAWSDADRDRLPANEVVHARVQGPRQIGWARHLVPTLLAAELDLLHLHGIWMYPSRAGERWAAATRRPYIVSPHGMLDPWITARSRKRKALARWGYERRNWRRASLLHALTADEAGDIVRESGRTDTVVIPNAAPAGGTSGVHRAGMLYLGRLHAKKNLAALIEAWSMTRTGGAMLTIAGWGDAAEVATVEAAVAAAGPCVNFVGPIQGDAKAALLASTRWLVLPSHSEGLPMVVLEAWAAGTPTVMTDACHLPEGFASGAALSCGTTTGSIAQALTAALATPPDRWQQRSAAARALAAGRFSAAAISARWCTVYEDLMR